MNTSNDTKRLASFYIASIVLCLPAIPMLVLGSADYLEPLFGALFGGLAVYYLSFAIFEKPRLFYLPEQLTTGVMRLLAAAWGVLWLFFPVDTLMDDPTTILIFLATLWLFFISLALLSVGFEPDSKDR